MAYKIGQLRRNQISSYSTEVDYNTSFIVNIDSSIDFYDPDITVNGGGQVSSTYSNETKYLKIVAKDSVQDFIVKLKNNAGSSENEFQTIKTLSVKSGVDYVTFELIFNPNKNYNQIVFELKRIASDFSISEQGKNGRVMDIEILDFYIINNIINDYLKSQYVDLQQLKKIGIQGPPGLMFTIDGEEIRLGKTGIYELYNDKIQISYLGFIIKESVQVPDGKDFFILDFKY